jgi:hypothetical protein
MPMETDTLEFNANVEGDWFFHCHILYHMMSGMGRVFSYENQAPNPLIPNPKLANENLQTTANFILWLKTILQPMETMEWRWFKALVGALAQNGV